MTREIPPQPYPDPDSLPFWESARAGRLVLCRCSACGLWHQPPLERCRACGAPTRFEEVAGTGVLASFIVVRHPAVAGYLTDLPYVVGLVELDEQRGLRLPARLVGVAPDALRIGLRLRAEIVPLAGGDFRVPVFRPIAVLETHEPSGRTG
jgi:uncharacterized OB-fold protein